MTLRGSLQGGPTDQGCLGAAEGLLEGVDRLLLQYRAEAGDAMPCLSAEFP